MDNAAAVTGMIPKETFHDFAVNHVSAILIKFRWCGHMGNFLVFCKPARILNIVIA